MRVKLFLTKKSTIVAILGFCILAIFLIVENLHLRHKEFLQNQLNTQSKAELGAVRSNLESAIHSDIYYANSLATLLTVNPNATLKQWALIAEELYRDSRHIRHLAIAPNDVIRYVYPFKGNEKALGLDFRTLPVQWLTLKKARQMKSIFVAGPVDLVQGGRAFIARMPIFSDPPLNQEYWGSVSIVINSDALFTNTGIFKLASDYPVAMRGKDSKGSDGDIFLGEKRIFNNPIIIENVALPYGSWQIAIKQINITEVYSWYRVYVMRLVGYTFFTIMLLSIIIMFRLYVVAMNRCFEDELTKLPNRRYFMYTLNVNFSKGKKDGKKFVLLNLDLDKFKDINDTYGHIAGDVVLKEVANRVSKVLRSNDVVARIGGDEYVILLPRIHEIKDIHKVIDKIRSSIGDEPITFENHLITVKTSIGYSRFDSKMNSVDELLHKADRSMYSDKQGHMGSILM